VLTPSDYKKRYENIDVRLKDGRSVTVKVNKYRLAGKNVNTTARSAFLAALAKRGIDTPLRIDTDQGITRIDPRVTHEKQHDRQSEVSNRLVHDKRLIAATQFGSDELLQP